MRGLMHGVLALASVLIMAPTGLAQCPGSWGQAAGGPSGRHGSALAYDSLRSRVVLFGGRGAGGLLNDTWAWDGAAWEQLTIDGPSPPARRLGDMVYDDARDRLVLFGGALGCGGNSTPLGDTWEFDGATNTWTEVGLASAPDARWSHGMAYDAERARTVLFGGTINSGSANTFGDTWEFDGDAWTEVDAQEPGERRGMRLAWDGEQVLLFGGSAAPTGLLDDLWSYDGDAWSLLAACGPGGRAEGAVAFDSGRGRLVVFGSFGTSGLNDTWEWDGEFWVQAANDGPSPRGSTHAAFHPPTGQFMFFGGRNSSNCNAGFNQTRVWTGPLGDEPVTPFIGELAVNGVAGQDIELTVAPFGSGPFTYQWRKDGGPLVDGGAFIGTTSPTLSIVVACSADSGAYDVVVTSAPCGAATSKAVEVEIEFTGDLDKDGVVGSADLNILLGGFGCGGPPEACDGDVDGDGDVDSADLNELLGAFASSCL